MKDSLHDRIMTLRTKYKKIVENVCDIEVDYVVQLKLTNKVDSWFNEEPYDHDWRLSKVLDKFESYYNKLNSANAKTLAKLTNRHFFKIDRSLWNLQYNLSLNMLGIAGLNKIFVEDLNL